MKSVKKKNKVPEFKDKETLKRNENKMRLFELEERLGEVIWAFSLVKSSEAHWDTQEMIFSFENREDMIPLMGIANCVFASKGNCIKQQVEVI
jgi:hypothetical protein